MSPREWAYTAIVIAVGLTVTLTLAYLASDVNHYKLPEHRYKIAVKGEQAMEMRADYIDRRDGCVLFYRDKRIDTILCENMEPVVVTEVYE